MTAQKTAAKETMSNVASGVFAAHTTIQVLISQKHSRAKSHLNDKNDK